MTSTSGNLISPVSRTLYLPVAVGGLYQRPSPVPVDSSTSKAATWEPQVKTCSWCCSTGRMRRPVDPRVAQAHISRVRFKQQLAAEGAVRVGMDFNTPRVRFEPPPTGVLHGIPHPFNTPRVRFERGGAGGAGSAASRLSIPQGYDSNSSHHTAPPGMQPFQYPKGTIRTVVAAAVAPVGAHFQYPKGTIRTNGGPQGSSFCEPFNTPRVRFERSSIGASARRGPSFNTPRVRFERASSRPDEVSRSTFNTPRVRFEPCLPSAP